jgi:FtsH-binding integral membrane protein
MTALVVIALTVYALRTTNDFTLKGGSLYIFAVAVAVSSLALFILPHSSFWFSVISGLSVILFGLYLIYDVQIIVGGGRYEISEEDYILAALIVYLDIVMLFLHILELIGDKNKK